jgi:hypothetical protein
MLQITSVLRKKIAQLTGDIQKLQSQRSALSTALQSIEGKSGRTRRPSVPARAAVRVKRTTGARRKRGANQDKVISLLARTPRRLNKIAAGAKLTMSAAGGVLRVLIAKGRVAKGDKRGTYVLKGAPVARPSTRYRTHAAASA